MVSLIILNQHHFEVPESMQIEKRANVLQMRYFFYVENFQRIYQKNLELVSQYSRQNQ